MSLTENLKGVLNKKNNTKEKIESCIKGAISNTDRLFSSVAEFRGSSLKKLDIGPEKDYIEFVLEISLLNEDKEVSIVI